jgi:exonuclease VII small subunit
MSGLRAAQQIGNLLSQSGVPSGVALDIAQRLLTVSGYGQSRMIDGNSFDANSSTFRNQYKPPEQPDIPTLGNRAAQDGVSKDGQNGLNGYGWNGWNGQSGVNGKDGQDGKDGVVDYKRIQDMINGTLAGYFGGGGGCGCKKEFDDLKRRMQALEDRMDGLERDVKALDDKLKSYIRGLKTLRRMLDDLEKRVSKIEKRLKETVECPTE